MKSGCGSFFFFFLDFFVCAGASSSSSGTEAVSSGSRETSFFFFFSFFFGFTSGALDRVSGALDRVSGALDRASGALDVFACETLLVADFDPEGSAMASAPPRVCVGRGFGFGLLGLSAAIDLKCVSGGGAMIEVVGIFS